MNPCDSSLVVNSNRFSALEVDSDSSPQSIQGEANQTVLTVALVEHTSFNKYVVKPADVTVDGAICKTMSIAESFMAQMEVERRETQAEREKRQHKFMTDRRQHAIERRKKQQDEREKRNANIIESMYKDYMNATRYMREAQELDTLCQNGPGVFATYRAGFKDSPQPLMSILLNEINHFDIRYRNRIDKYIAMITTYEEVAYVQMILKRKMYYIMKDRRLQEESRRLSFKTYLDFWSVYKPMLDGLETAITMKAMAAGRIGVQAGDEIPDRDYSGVYPNRDYWGFDECGDDDTVSTFGTRMKKVYSSGMNSLSTVASFKDMLSDVMDSMEGVCDETCMPYIRCIEDIALFYFLDFPKISSSKEAIFCLYRLAKSITGYSVCDSLFGWINSLIKAVNEHCDICTQAGSDLEEDFFHKFMKGSAFGHMQKLACALSTVAISQIFFAEDKKSDPSMHSDKTRNVFERVWDYFKPLLKKKLKWDIVTTVFEFCKWMVTRGIEIIRGEATFESFFFDEDKAKIFDERVAALGFMHESIETGRDTTITLEKYMFEVLELEKLARVEFETAENKMLKVALQRQLTYILEHKAEMLRMYEAEANRPAPFAILLHGTTSVGKTMVTNLITPQLQRAMGARQGPEYVFNFDTNDKYMSGMSYDKNTIILDDLANTALAHTEKVASDFVIYIINNYKRFALKADVESKGKIPLKPDLVIASTNVPDLHCKVTSSEPLSIMRRFEYHIEVKVKDSCGEGPPGKKMIKKYDHDPNTHGFDCWKLSFSKYVPHHESEKFKKEMIPGMQNLSIDEAMKFLVKEASAFKKKQDALVARMKVMHKDEYCCHNIFKYLCKECSLLDAETRRINEAVNSIPLQLQIGTMAGGALDQFVRSASWNVGHQADRFASWCKANSLKQPDAQQKPKNNFSMGTTAKALMSFAMWKREKTQWWQTLLMSVVGIALAPLVSWSAPIYAVLWTASVSGVYLATSALRIVQYMRISPYKTMVETVHRIRKDWKSTMKSLLPLCIVIGTSYTAYKVWKYYQLGNKIESQGCKVSLPIPQGVSGRKDPYRPPAISIPVSNVNLRTATSDQMCTIIEQKLCLLRFKKEGVYKEHCVTMPLCTGYWFVPIHLLEKGYDFVDIVKCNTLHNNSTRTANLRGAWRRIGKTDYALLYLPVMGDQRDLRRLLPDGDSLPMKAVGARCIWLKADVERIEGEKFISLTRGQYKVHFTTEYVKPFNLNFGYDGGKYESPSPTWEGMCGSALISDINGPILVGLHSAGQAGTGEARTCTILKRDVDECISAMTDRTKSQILLVQSGNFAEALHYKGTNFEYTPSQRPKATSIFVDNGGFDFLGSSTAPHRTMRSRVKPTLIADTVCKVLDINIKHGAPRYINHWGPWNTFVTAMSSPSDIPCDILDKAYYDYLTKIMDGWKDEWAERIHPLAEDAVLSGIDGLQGCYAMNFKASMGIPYCKPKGDYILPSDRKVENISYPRDMPEHLREEIRVMEEALAAGQRVYTPHRCSLKDEPTKLEKDKVRVFMGSAFAYQFLMRKYFLMVSIIMQENPELFESAVGVKAGSYEWTRLHKHIFKYSKTRCIAGDYTKYDQKLDVKVTMAMFKILIYINERAGYSEFQLAVCRGLATETCMAIYDVRNEWLQFNCGNSSGNPLTVVINSGSGSILKRCAYYALKPDHVTALFHKLVSLITYGDDNAMSVHEAAEWFNHTTIADILSAWGMGYTMADKSSESVPYIPSEKIEFLKRTWVWSERFERYLCPLAESSIHKALTCALESDTLSREQHSAEIVAGANLEYFFYGEETFKLRHEQLKAILREHDILHHVPGGKLKTYEELATWYME